MTKEGLVRCQTGWLVERGSADLPQGFIQDIDMGSMFMGFLTQDLPPSPRAWQALVQPQDMASDVFERYAVL